MRRVKNNNKQTKQTKNETLRLAAFFSFLFSHANTKATARKIV